MDTYRGYLNGHLKYPPGISQLIADANNFIGKVLHYPTCPVTGDTLWRRSVVAIPYSDQREVLVREFAIFDYAPEDVARKVFAISQNQDAAGVRYTLEQITQIAREILSRFDKEDYSDFTKIESWLPKNLIN